MKLKIYIAKFYKIEIIFKKQQNINSCTVKYEKLTKPVHIYPKTKTSTRNEMHDILSPFSFPQPSLLTSTSLLPGFSGHQKPI